ncbi:MAG: adenylate/guanylate cyclase domain-containing protein [Treponema sp.]
MSKNVQDSAGRKRIGTAVRFPIGVKLALIIGIVVLVSLGTVTVLNSYFIGQDVKITAENNNLSINSRAAGTVEDKLTTVRANVFQLLDLMNVVSGGRSSALAKQAEAFFFERNQDVASIYVISAESADGRLTGYDTRILNTRFFTSNEIEPNAMNAFITGSREAISRSCQGETIAVNSSPFFNVPVMSLLFPWKENGRDQTCIITFSMESINDILGSGSVNTTFMINDTDDLISHPETDRVLIGENLKNNPLIEAMRKNNENNADSRQIVYTADDGEGNKAKFYGAYQKLSMADAVILTTVPIASVLEGVVATRRNNIYLTGIVFFLSIMLVLWYARYGISRPLRKLTDAAEEIQKGNFDTPLFNTLNTKRGDEIGVLNQSTKDELDFLHVFARFTNNAVAKAIARKEIDFDPHLKDITIFFSDIRGFTAISDGFKNKFADESPREIIGFLNDYMSRMVNCITLSHGNVDKFEGDAIMAVWGIMRDDSLDYDRMPDSPEKLELKRAHAANVKQDAVNAIRGTIAMRYALMQYNKDAEAFTKAHANEPKAQYKPHIRIGCGLNTGRATCGILGSEDKLEYTAIGDAVNFASRTESSNKACGTDILITETTYRILRNEYIKCEANGFKIPEENKANEIVVEMIPVEFEVKGKGAQHFYGVVNMPGFDIEEFFRAGDPNFTADPDCLRAVGAAGPKTLNEVRNLLGIPIPDFEKVNLNEEENKVQVKN